MLVRYIDDQVVDGVRWWCETDGTLVAMPSQGVGWEPGSCAHLWEATITATSDDLPVLYSLCMDDVEGSLCRAMHATIGEAQAQAARVARSVGWVAPAVPSPAS